MNHKGKMFVAVMLSFLAAILQTKAQTYGSTNDLWDVRQGTFVTYTTGVQGSTSDPGMFGGNDGGTITTHFVDGQTNGFVHVIEWRMIQPVPIGRIALWAAGDGAIYNNGREFSRFTLRAKSPGSSVFDRTILTFVPTHPYTFIGDKKILDTNITPVAATEYRGEFEQINLRPDGWNGPRVIELDAYVAPPQVHPVVSLTSPAAGSAPTNRVILAGSINSAAALTSVRWERNGVNMGSLPLSGSSFNQLINLLDGQNIIRVVATDSNGLEGSAQVQQVYAQYAFSNDDLWDVRNGTIVTASSEVYPESNGSGMFGGLGSGSSWELYSTIFADNRPDGHLHFIEWRTQSPVTVGKVRLFATGNMPPLSPGREFSSFVLKTKSPGSTNYDRTVLNFNTTSPYTLLDTNSFLILETNITAIVGQDFRGEFTQRGLSTFMDGPRVFELDAFAPAQNYGVKNDLFDVSNGTILTANSGLQSSVSDPGMIGGADEPFSPETTHFADDKPSGFTHYAEWRTASAVTVSQIKLYAAGDGAIYSHGREFGRFTLKAKSPGSSVFDKTLVTFIPTHPYTYIGDKFVLDTNFSAFTAQEFRGEFEQVNLRAEGWNAPRVIEVDAFGPPSPPEPIIFQQPASIAVLPGDTANFSVAVSGTPPFSYSWRKGTNVLLLSSRIESMDGKSLLIRNVTSADVGSYSVIVTNQFGIAQSAVAHLTLIPDTNAPIVTITAPTNGIVGSKAIALEGFTSDNFAVVATHWQRNGEEMGSLVLSNGFFRVSSVALSPGENRLKVIALDSTGNEGSAEVTLVVSPAAQSNADLWDISRGTTVTYSSEVYMEQGGPGLFGGDGFGAEVGSTIFSDDKPDGFAHIVEWKTVTPVTISTVRLFAGGDGEIYSNGREIGRFTLKAKTPGSTNYNVTVFSYVPPHPYVVLDSDSHLILETNFPAFTAQEFRGEFEQVNLRPAGFNAPRVIELDAFGPSSGGAPQIVSQPSAQGGFAGSDVTFLVGVTGASPLSYQWKRDGSNLLESAKFDGVNSWSLTVKNIQPQDAGNYSVLVSNALGETNSNPAALTVSVDSTPPVVIISSPLAGAQTNGTFQLSGSVSDSNGVASVTYEINGRVPNTVPLTNGRFTVNSLNFDFGDNIIKVTATDLSGNVGVAEVLANWTVPRALVLGTPPPTQDGLRFTVPVILVSTGGVSGATFSVTYDSNYVADAQIEWRSAAATAFTSFNQETARRVRATFALPGSTIPAGSIPIANLSFRARSVPTNIQTQLRLELAGIYSDTGDPFESNNSVLSTVATINKRKITGDNNANDRLDVGDASSILRLITGFDFPRPWDRVLNDLNRNGNVDSGDVIRVLRAVVELDPQPTIPISSNSVAKPAKSPSIAFARSSLNLVADKPNAAPGEKVTVEVLLADQTKPVTGISFRLDYPIEALKLDGPAGHTVGGIVPTGAALIWNVAPSQNNYLAQSGSIALGVSTGTPWVSSNGVVARFTFTVQATATGSAGWPVRLSNGVVAREGGLVDSLGGTEWSFVPRIPTQPKFSSSVEFIGQTPRLTFQGDNGAIYIIQASNDLINWLNISTNTATTGSIVIDDPAGTGESSRFYRALQK